MHVSADLETTMGKRVTELNEKDMQFQISLLEERQQKLNAKVIKKSSEIEDHLFLVKKKMVAVEEPFQ